ncbi:SPASM domain-containing protein [Streptomyces sp. NPDC053429]|uniref:SPASM domain-containing protein n=1 Tax=Streptomyces sp. NPDC053429 TaxID=3365702 RepID=UPI0037D16ECE
MCQLCGYRGQGNATVSGSGDVCPCVFSRWLPVGNVLDNSLADIRTGPGMAGRRSRAWGRCALRAILAEPGSQGLPVAPQHVGIEVGVQVLGRLCLADHPLVHQQCGGVVGQAVFVVRAPVQVPGQDHKAVRRPAQLCGRAGQGVQPKWFVPADHAHQHPETGSRVTRTCDAGAPGSSLRQCTGRRT